MTALFDRYAIVDWSASNTPTTGKDSIWIAFAEREGREVGLLETLNPSTRSAAMARLRQFFRDALADNKRVLAGFDFPFGYPAGAAEAIAGAPDWRAVWRAFGELLHDRDDNFSNRFEVAGRLNREALAFAPMFWGRPAHQDIPGLPVAKPAPYPTSLAERRLAELRAPKAQPVWKLAYAGSVGSQAITGIARLQQLTSDEEFAGQVAVWPFETGFAARLGGAPVVLAEVYPGLFAVEQGEKSCLDEAQAETLALEFARLDADERLAGLLAAPADLGEDDKRRALEEEGWILGVGHALFAEAGAQAPPAPGAEPGLRYLRDPQAIYAESFRTIRAEADLSAVPAEAQELAIRLIHACGMTDILGDLVISPGAVEAGREALDRGAPILCDSEMVAHGVITRNLPQHNKVICRLADPRVARIAEREQTTRSAAQVDLWSDQMAGAVVAIGNAPTALYRLLERLDEGAARPALIIAMPVGFVGAAESKEELLRDSRGVPFLTIRGRRGGSALAAAAVNALAKGLE